MTASHSFTPQLLNPPPLRLLRYLEWILLGFTILTILLAPPFAPFPGSFLIPLAVTVVFGFMGLWNPGKHPAQKAWYTVAELLVLWIPTILNDRIHFIPTLGLVIVIRSCQRFQLIGRLSVAAIVFFTSMLIIALHEPPLKIVRSLPLGRPQPPDDRLLIALKLNASVSFGLAIVFILLLINALLAERQSRDRLIIAHEQLRQYALRIEDQATLQERNRIAREIHDSLGHALTAQSIQLFNALQFLQSDVDKARGFLTEAKKLGTQALTEVRQSVTTLRSDPLQGRSLFGAVATLVSEFHATSGIVPIYTNNLVSPLTTEVSTAVYRILQEALTNISRHSNATSVTICLQEVDHSLCLLIMDDGTGFDPNQNTTGFGLLGMQERTIALGGQFSLISQPDAGCTITIRLPLMRALA